MTYQVFCFHESFSHSSGLEEEVDLSRVTTHQNEPKPQQGARRLRTPF